MIMSMSTDELATQAGAGAGAPRRPDRRARRRQQTIAEILDIAAEVMTEEGVNGLSLAEVARRLGVQPPSLYKYFPSLMAVYDELFRRGQAEHLAVMRRPWPERARAGRADRRPGGQRTLAAGQPCDRPADVLAARPRLRALSRSVRPQRGDGRPPACRARRRRRRRELGPGADSDEAVYLVSTLIIGVLSQAIANEPGLPWGEGRFTTQFPRLMKLLIAAYPVAPDHGHAGPARRRAW